MAFLLVLNSQAINRKKAIPIIPFSIDIIEKSKSFIFYYKYVYLYQWIALAVDHLQGLFLKEFAHSIKTVICCSRFLFFLADFTTLEFKTSFFRPGHFRGASGHAPGRGTCGKRVSLYSAGALSGSEWCGTTTQDYDKAIATVVQSL